MARRAGRLAALAALLAVGAAARSARASGNIESPEASTAQIGRGGAWLARADDPMATYFNPAALATQPSGAHLGAQLLFKHHCMDRRAFDPATGEANRVAPAPNQPAPPDEVCAKIAPSPNPQFGLALRLHERVALGLAVLAPHTVAGIEWPATVDYGGVPHPSPTRYLLLKTEALGAFPTLGLGVSITDWLQVGAGFVWGLATLELATMIEGTSTADNPGGLEPDDFGTDIRAQLNGFDGFVPGFVLSGLVSPHRRFDIAAWYRWSDAIKTKVDLRTEAPFYTTRGEINPSPTVTEVKDAGTFKLAIPMEAKIGFRYRHPRAGAEPQRFITQHGRWARDSLSQDEFDLELDVTYANGTQVDDVEIRIKPNTVVDLGGIQALVPENGDVPHNYRHVVGVRLGGEYVIIPDLFALRAGLFFESPGQDPKDLHIDFHQGWKLGGGGGLTLRFDRFDISAAYQHTHWGKLDNGGQGTTKALSGDATRADGRSIQSINGGSTTASLNEVALGVGVHW